MHLSIAALAIATCCSRAHATHASLVARQELQDERPIADPDLESFDGRADISVVILDDYLYMLGGHVAHELDGKQKVGAINSTLSLSLSDDWYAADVEINTFATEDGPSFIYGNGLWPNPKDDEIVLWGGADVASNDVGARDRKLWKLKPDGSGGGSWTSEDGPSDIRRTTRAGYAACGGTGYALGGRGNDKTDKAAFEGGAVAVPGLATYDFEDGTWQNHSTTDVTKDGTWARGEALCVEMPDRSPKLLVLGGAHGTEEGDTNDFVYVHYWDPEKEKWFKQETSGTRPSPRVGSCSVGVPGPNGTYDIFIYSGWGGTFKDGSVLQDVWTLSIPAFRWFKGSLSNPQGRYAHACARVGSQMIVVGGGSRRDWWKSDDTFDRGFGIMDLNSMSWKNEFQAKSQEYESPEPVRQWYAKNGYDTTVWENEEVQKAFSQSSNDDGNDGNDGNDESTTNTSPAPSSSNTEDPDSDSGSESSSPNTAAIAGGVVGGVAGLALIGLAAWYILRRRRRQPQVHGSSHAPESEQGYYVPVKPPVEADGSPSTRYTSTPQMGPPQYPQELDATGRDRPVEMP